MKFSSIACLLPAVSQLGLAAVIHQRPNGIVTLEDATSKRDVLQDIVTWDDKSLMIHGQRLMIFSAEFHPFRLPSPSLWLDVLQKIRALGFNTISIYLNWALVEGTPGDFRSEGVFSFKTLFDAAVEAGIWIIARPGPYINAEVSGGGFPGWLQRINGTLRTDDPVYLNATANYAQNINKLIADAQITNGGPVILFQPENEYYGPQEGGQKLPPDQVYLAEVIKQARDAGVVIPLHSNDGGFQQSQRVIHPGPGEVDILGYDSYPLGFDCSTDDWGTGAIPWDVQKWHNIHNPTAPLSTPEFQGGSFTSWGGASFDACVGKFNQEFERIFYKELYGLGLKIINLYMTYGGTNWGNLGQPEGPTSYDYGAAIAEDRSITREKYAELKLQANFMRVAPGYLTASTDASGAKYSSNDIVSVTARLNDKVEDGHFFVARQATYGSTESVEYTLELPTSANTTSIPQLGGKLTINGRDSKVHVTDFDVGGTNLLYSTAEVFTWKKLRGGKKVLILYGGAGELHELAVKGSAADAKIIEGSDVKIEDKNGFAVMQYTASSDRRAVEIGDLQILLLDRNSVYSYWVTDLPGSGETIPKSYGTSLTNPESIIINGPYLSRTVEIKGRQLLVTADFNATAFGLEVIGIPDGVDDLFLNGRQLEPSSNKIGAWSIPKVSGLPTSKPNLPDLKTLDWYTLDAIPEVSADFDVSAFPKADLEKTYNSYVSPQTPTSLFASDYGFNAGSLVYVGTVNATSGETQLSIDTQGGTAFASATWFDGEFLGSFSADQNTRHKADTFDLGKTLEAGSSHRIFTVVDHMGLEENYNPGDDTMKEPRGILNWSLLTPDGPSQATATWHITGNFGGEQYVDKARGPLNEGGLFVERQGYHLPNPPVDKLTKGSPLDGVTKAGLNFYTTNFTLDIPANHDVPISVVFDNSDKSLNYRAFIYVNGWQFGRYVNQLGPQNSFPVPEGILNHRGENWLSVVVWALGKDGVKVGISLDSGVPVLSGMKAVELVDSPAWEARKGVY